MEKCWKRRGPTSSTRLLASSSWYRGAQQLYNEASLALCWSTCSWWWRPGLMVEVEGGSGAAKPWEGKCWGPRVTARPFQGLS